MNYRKRLSSQIKQLLRVYSICTVSEATNHFALVRRTPAKVSPFAWSRVAEPLATQLRIGHVEGSNVLSRGQADRSKRRLPR